MQNLGSEYLDHYEKYFGNPAYRYVMDDGELPRKIQLLKYDNVFEGCTTFASLGVSSYSNELKGNFFEVVVVVDACLESIPKLLFSVIRTIILQNIEFDWGSYFTGLEGIDESFVSVTGKDTFYATLPSPLPKEFGIVPTSNSFLAENNIRPKVFMGLFISGREKEYLKVNGKEKFEERLELLNIDPFDICRADTL
jgi:hypothetical protein